MSERAPRYVAGLALVAMGALATVLFVVPARWPTPLELFFLVVGIALAERTEVVIEWDRTRGAFTLADVAVVAGLLLVPSPLVAVAVIPAVALAHVRPDRPAIKVIYNIASATLATAVAALLLHYLPTWGPLIGQRSVPAVLIGMVGYGTAVSVAFHGLLVRLQGQDTARRLRAQVPMLAGSTLACASVGIVLAALWELQPALVPFVLAPAAAVHLAQRSSVQAATSLAERRTEHARLERVVDGASDGIVLLDADALVRVWNPAMERLTGRPADDVVGRPVASALNARVRDAARTVTGRWTLADARAHTPVLDQESVLIDAAGERREVTESHAFTFDDRGRCDGAVVVIRDVSRQRELERLRSDFVSRVSHELRTPLTPIRGFASVLLRRWDLLDADQRTEALTRIVERADDLHSLVEDLLLVTRVDTDDLDGLVHEGPIDLEVVARAAVEELCQRQPDRTVTLAVDAGPPWAHADPDRVRKILDALLDNAGRYTAPDTPIEVDLDRQGDDVLVRVTDHGSGVPPSEREAIFERFHRLEDPLTMRTSGMGVGLFLSRQLAEAMHGSLQVEPTPPGEGAAFVLRLPVSLERPSDSTGPSGSEPRSLRVVGDDPEPPSRSVPGDG